jgi:hypothetical protein
MSDTTGPTLTLLNSSTSNSGTGQQVTFTLGASDNLSGVQSGIIWFDHLLSTVDQWGNTSSQTAVSLGSTADPLSDGLASTTVTASSFAAGNYKISLTLFDNSGNRRDYSNTELASLGMSTSFTITEGNQQPAANVAPTITSNGGGDTAALSIAENTLAVTTVIATDPDAGQTLSYSIAGGADAGKFTIGSTTGALSFVNAPNFDLPTDTGGNNVYDVTVQVSDGNGGTDTQAIAVTVQNVDMALSFSGAVATFHEIHAGAVSIRRRCSTETSPQIMAGGFTEAMASQIRR